MPRGQNPNSKKALEKNRKKTQFSGDSAVRANKKSQKVKKEFASFRECFKSQMDDEKRQEMFDMLYGRAKRGNLKAFEILRDTMGEKTDAEDTSALQKLDTILEGVMENAKSVEAKSETE